MLVPFIILFASPPSLSPSSPGLVPVLPGLLTSFSHDYLDLPVTAWVSGISPFLLSNPLPKKHKQTNKQTSKDIATTTTQPQLHIYDGMRAAANTSKKRNNDTTLRKPPPTPPAPYPPAPALPFLVERNHHVGTFHGLMPHSHTPPPRVPSPSLQLLMEDNPIFFCCRADLLQTRLTKHMPVHTYDFFFVFAAISFIYEKKEPHNTSCFIFPLPKKKKLPFCVRFGRLLSHPSQ